MHGARSAVLLCLAGFALAAEKPAPTTPVPPASAEEDSIAAAKRDLETIKAARGGVEHPRVNLPQFSTPEIQFGTPAPGRPAGKTTAEDAAAAKRSANWLVDAMLKKSERGVEGKDRAETRDRGAGRLDGLENEALASDRAMAPDGARGGGQAERREARPASEPVVNPLTNFMAGWMTPQDFKLLQPGLGAESTADLVARGASASFMPVASMGGDGAGLSPLGKPSPARPAQGQRENPFLQDLATPAPAPVKLPVALPPGAPSAPAPKLSPLTPESVPAQKPAIPAFVKPQDDAKYFKPLKRF